MDKVIALLQLMRADRPIGWLLLLWPTMWGLWSASGGVPTPELAWIFVLGVLVMRAAGCVINDFADRDIDPLVERTQTRPLAAKRVSAREAMALFIVLMFVALGLLLLLPMRAWPWALVGAALTVIYPFMKRFIQAPQLVLGCAFTVSIPMAYAAAGAPFDGVFWALVLSNIVWVVAYDTAYAMSDREDDLKIGVKSTAILFGQYDRAVLLMLQVVFLAVWGWIATQIANGHSLWLALVVVTAHFAYQQWLIKDRARAECFQAFLNNGWVGAWLWFGLVVALG